MQGSVEIRLNITSPPLTASSPAHASAPSLPDAVIIIIAIIIFFVRMCRCYGNSSCFSDFRVVCLIIRALVSHSLSLLLSFPLSLTLSLSFTFQLYSLHSHRPFLIFQLPPFFLILGFLHTPYSLVFPSPMQLSAVLWQLSHCFLLILALSSCFVLFLPLFPLGFACD